MSGSSQPSVTTAPGDAVPSASLRCHPSECGTQTNIADTYMHLFIDMCLYVCVHVFKEVISVGGFTHEQMNAMHSHV